MSQPEKSPRNARRRPRRRALRTLNEAQRKLPQRRGCSVASGRQIVRALRREYARLLKLPSPDALARLHFAYFHSQIDELARSVEIGAQTLKRWRRMLKAGASTRRPGDERARPSLHLPPPSLSPTASARPRPAEPAVAAGPSAPCRSKKRGPKRSASLEQRLGFRPHRAKRSQPCANILAPATLPPITCPCRRVPAPSARRCAPEPPARRRPRRSAESLPLRRLLRLPQAGRARRARAAGIRSPRRHPRVRGSVAARHEDSELMDAHTVRPHSQGAPDDPTNHQRCWPGPRRKPD